MNHHMNHNEMHLFVKHGIAGGNGTSGDNANNTGANSTEQTPGQSAARMARARRYTPPSSWPWWEA